MAGKAKPKTCVDDRSLTATGVTCPACRGGELVPTRGRFGLMYACSTRPRCSYWLKARPTGQRCEYREGRGRRCGALMMEGTKTIPERCSDRECPNHDPRKLPRATSVGATPRIAR